MQRKVTYVIGLALATVFLAPAVAAGPPGAIVLEEDETPTGERCYILNVPPWMGFGFETVQYYVEDDGETENGIKEGVGTANDLANRADSSAEGFLADLPGPDSAPIQETVFGPPSGLQVDAGDDTFPGKWEKKGWASADHDLRLDEEGFQATCLGP